MNDLQKHILKVLREWQEQDRKIVAAIEGGKARYHESRGQGIVDTTAETLATTNKRISEAEDLIKRFELQS
jgi:hypothetical protein